MVSYVFWCQWFHRFRGFMVLWFHRFLGVNGFIGFEVSWCYGFIGFVESRVLWFHRFRGVNGFMVSCFQLTVPENTERSIK